MVKNIPRDCFQITESEVFCSVPLHTLVVMKRIIRNASPKAFVVDICCFWDSVIVYQQQSIATHSVTQSSADSSCPFMQMLFVDVLYYSKHLNNMQIYVQQSCRCKKNILVNGLHQNLRAPILMVYCKLYLFCKFLWPIQEFSRNVCSCPWVSCLFVVSIRML